MKTKKQKGFTLVELVIVIAVIAILAAVLIPTFSNLIQKANQSADIQAVRQMNTHLATYVDGSVTNVSAAVSALDEENIDLDDYKPLQKNHYFYFVLDKNNTPMVIYTDEKDNIVFPTNTNIASDAQWMSLSGDVPTDSSWESNVTNGSVEISSGAQLADLIDSVSEGNSKNISEIKLSGNVDLKGAAVDFGTTTNNIIIKGESDSTTTTLSGLRSDNNSVSPTSGEFAGHQYGFGIFGKIKSGTVKLENLTISGLVAGNTAGNHAKGANTVGLVAGYVDSGATLEMNNVTFKDCSVYGYQKVGGIVGQLHGTLNMNNVKFENTTVSGYYEAAKIAGIVGCNYTSTSGSYQGSLVEVREYNSSTSTGGGKLLYDEECNFDGITVNGLIDNDSDGVLTKSQINGLLKGHDSNSYVKYDDILFGNSTCDLAWYYIDDNATVNNPIVVFVQKDNCYKYNNSVTINNSKYTLVAYTYSTSNQIENGKPKSE